MKKRMLGLAFVLILMLVLGSQTSSAGPPTGTSFDDLWLDLIKGSTAVQKSDVSVYQAQLGVYNAKLTRGDAINMLDLNDKWGLLGKADELQFVLARDLVPDQARYQNETTYAYKQLTLNTLKSSLRDVYLGLFNAQTGLELKKERQAQAEKKLAEAETKLTQGLISKTDYEEAQFALFKAQKESAIAGRDLEKLQLNLNQLLGADLQTRHVVLPEAPRTDPLPPVETYINEANKNRFEVVDLKRQIDLKAKEKSIYESGTFLRNATVKEDYRYVVLDNEKLAIQLIQAENDIETEIRQAYEDVKNAENQLTQLQNTLQNSYRGLRLMAERFDRGLISETDFADTQLSVQELETQIQVMEISYNSKRMKLELAAQIGPGY